MIGLIMLLSMHDGNDLHIPLNPDDNKPDLKRNLSNPSLFNAFPAKMPTSGVYWTVFSGIPDSAYTLGGLTFGVGCYVKHASICEPGTGQILADMRDFPDSVDCMTYKDPSDGVQYWLGRTQDSKGKTTSIKVACTGANIPYLNLTMFGHKPDLPYPELELYNVRPDGNVVHTPEGAVLSDPYSDPALKFGGFKRFCLLTKKYKQGVELEKKVKEAGYDCWPVGFKDGVYMFDVQSTDIGRAKIEEDVLEKNNWFLVEGGGHGNRGTYELCDTVIFNITSHSNGETVKNQKIKLEGTITNRASEFDPITSLQVMNTSGTESKRVDAIITSDSTFTADVELLTGLNILVLLPKHKNSERKEVYHTKFITKIKDEPADAVQLTYDAGWGSRIVITRRIKTMTFEPDSSITEKFTQISANLKIDFNSSKLWYIRKSFENARSCAEFDNCWLFSGKDDGSVRISEKYTKKTKDCDRKLPLITVVRSEGNGVSDKYRLNITATLTPWAENDNSTERRYHLCISSGPEFSLQTSHGLPIKGQYYDCTYKKWISSSNTMDPVIKINKEKALLKFPMGKELEDYTESPVTAKTWTFSGREKHDDGYSVTVTEYSVTLTIHP
ncbi:MAG: hypothetical protein PHP30_01160 [Bacteroidales bacterium]|nr:hypothetical protein [Bacteroidales bacterium]MDD3988695.1 hypothetical protein [Bacteroidales bacterium]